MNFEFGWNKPKKVEMLNRGTQQTYLTEVSPKQIIKEPYGFREQDIIHSLCLVLSELIEMQEAQFQTQANQMSLNLTKTKEKINAIQQEEDENQEKNNTSTEPESVSP